MKQFQARYWKGTRTEKNNILNEYCALAGYHRKYAISLLNNVNDEQSKGKRRYPHANTKKRRSESLKASGRYKVRRM